MAATVSLRRYAQSYPNDTTPSAKVRLERFSVPYVIPTYEIASYVYKAGEPAAKREVVLYHKATGAMVSATLSADDGSFHIIGIPYIENGYTVIAHDIGADPNNADVLDPVTPTLVT